MNNLQVFNNPEFGDIRVLEIDGEPWFVGKDVATALEYSDAKAAIRDRVDSEDKQLIQRGQITPLEIPNRGLIVINESGLYSLVLSSKLPTAKRFKRWVTSEVLPSIRKHGGYIGGQESMSDEEIMARALLMAQSKIRERDQLIAKQTEQITRQAEQIEADKPKIIFADAVYVSSDTILVGELAKLLQQNGIQMGQNGLFEWMRAHGYLVRRKGSDYNMPTQRSMGMGLFEIREGSYVHPDGHIGITKTPKVTGRGQRYFINLFLARQ